MTKPNHTQWHVGMRNGHNANMIFVYDGEDQHGDTAIAMVYGLPSNRHISEIDPAKLDISRLIASAPMLLEALRDCIASLGGIESDNVPQSARDAIAAVTGETK